MSLQHYWPSNLVWLRLKIKQNHWSILKKCCNSYQFRVDVQTYGHRPWYTADNNATGCCYLSSEGNTILFRINISLPLKMIAGLDRADQCIGLPGHQTSHQKTSSYGATLKPWFTHHQLLLRRNILAVLLRQQQPSGSKLTLLGTYSCLCHIVVGCISRSLAIRLNICSKLVWNTAFFRNTLVILLDFQPQSDPIWRSVVLQGHSPTYSSLTVNLCFGSAHHLTKFGRGIFLHLL